MGKRHAPTDSIPQRVVEKVLTRVEAGADGCLLTLQGMGSHGYGQVGWTEGGVQFQGCTHRVLWIATHGPIPEGFDIHHECFERRCVNIDHLQAIPAFENRRRTNGDDWEIGLCKHGHSNELRKEINGRIRCAPCHEIWWMGYKAGRAAANERRGRRFSMQHAA